MTFYETPSIIQETSSGIDHYSIRDENFRQRKVFCTSEINEYHSNSIIAQLLYLQDQDPEAEITMYFDSPGGSVNAGMAIYDVMQLLSCPIRTICLGSAASMAAVLFTAGNKREMLPHSRIMIHDPLVTQTGGSALHLKSISDDLMDIREITAHILAEHTGRSLEEIYECTAKDTFFRADKAIEFGLADSIVNQL